MTREEELVRMVRRLRGSLKAALDEIEADPDRIGTMALAIIEDGRWVLKETEGV